MQVGGHPEASLTASQLVNRMIDLEEHLRSLELCVFKVVSEAQAAEEQKVACPPSPKESRKTWIEKKIAEPTRTGNQQTARTTALRCIQPRLPLARAAGQLIDVKE